jgi:protein TonB
MIAASRPLPAAVRYGTSLAVVLAVHALAIVVALNWKSAQPVPPPPPAMMMELAPLPEPEPEPMPPPPVMQPPKPAEEPPLPKLAEAPKPVIEVPKPKPQPPKPQPKVEPPKDVQPVEEPAPARPVAPVKAPVAPPAPAASNTPSWEGEVLGRLARFKKYPPAARSRGTQGQVVIAFTLDGQGRVLDANVDKSSGSSLLDRAALAAVREAQPLPAPPADKLRNGTITLRAPFVFNLTKG